MPFWTRKRVQEPPDGLATLRGQVEALESRVRTLGVEWQDVLDRMERLLQRLNKRDERAVKAEELPPPRANGLGAQGHDDEVLRRRTARVFPGRKGPA